jgi:hypothetical protein
MTVPAFILSAASIYLASHRTKHEELREVQTDSFVIHEPIPVCPSLTPEKCSHFMHNGKLETLLISKISLIRKDQGLEDF